MDDRERLVNLPTLDRGGVPFEQHVIKRRPGRREAMFLGRTRLVDGRREVEEGWFVKTVRPERVARLIAHYHALAAALAQGGPDAPRLPRVPPLVDSCAAEGRLVLGAFPGAALSALPEGPRRAGELARSAAALAALERSDTARALWPSREWSATHEAEGITSLAEELACALPPFAPALFARLAESEHALGSAPAHRDLNEEQVIAPPAEAPAEANAPVGWIDWDEAALAPIGLDLGNLLAHERLRALRNGSGSFDGTAVLDAYRRAGGLATPRHVATWEAAACLRLALLARRAGRGVEGERNLEWVPALPSGPAEAGRRALALEAIAGELAAR